MNSPESRPQARSALRSWFLQYSETIALGRHESGLLIILQGQFCSACLKHPLRSFLFNVLYST